MPEKVAKAKQPKIKLKGKRVEARQEESEEETVVESEKSRRGSNARLSGEGKKANLHYLMLRSLSPILEESQHSHADCTDLLERTLKVYDQGDKKIFTQVLWRMMIRPFGEKDKFDTIERTINFFYAMIKAINEREIAAPPESVGENSGNQTSLMQDNFAHRILRLCEKYHNESRPQVRMRVVETIVKVCEVCPNTDELDGSLKKKLANILQIRLKDKNHLVRSQAAKGLCYFQGGQGCPITSKMMEFIRIDPRPEVRRSLVLSIVLDPDDHSDFIDRVTDCHPEVRRACVRQIREIALDSLSLDEREKVMNCGLSDTSGAVRAETIKLLHHWFKSCEENPLKFLDSFDVYNHSKLCTKLFDVLFEEANDENWAILDKNLRIDKVLPLTEISELTFFLWWYLFRKFSSQPYYADKLFPSIAEISSYSKALIEKLETEHFEEGECIKIMSLFLKIVLFIPVEEGGRIELDKMARSIFKFQFLSVYHMRNLVLMIHKAHPTGCDEILLEIIRDLLESSISVKNGERGPQLNYEEEVRQKKVKVSEVLHKRYKLVKEKEEKIKRNEFLEAHQVQKLIEGVEEELAAVKEELRKLEADATAFALDNEEQSLAEPEYSSESLGYAFSAFFVHLKLIPKISPYLLNFYQADVVKSIFREEENLRLQVIEIMTQVGCSVLEEAMHAMVICLQAVLNETGDVKHKALQGIFDLVLHYGLDCFEDERIMSAFTQGSEMFEETQTVEKLLINLLTSFFKATHDEIAFHIAVVGMLKLLIMGRLKAPKIIATLLTFWANSANEGTKVYHDIGTGISVYVQQSSERAETVAMSLVPSVGKVINSLSTSSLRNVDPEKLMGYITMQTDQEKLPSISNPHIPHQIIAFDVLEEIRKRPLYNHNAVFVKALKGLNLKGIQAEKLVQLKSILKATVKEEPRTVRISLEAFGRYLDELDPEIRALAEMSDHNSCSEDEPEDMDDTDLFQSTSHNNGTVNQENDNTLSTTRNGSKSKTVVTNDSSEDENTVIENVDSSSPKSNPDIEKAVPRRSQRKR